MLIFRESDQVTKSHAKAAYMVAFCLLRENATNRNKIKTCTLI